MNDRLSKLPTEPREEDSVDYDHGSFWNQYSRGWEQDVARGSGWSLLGEEWGGEELVSAILRRFADPYLNPQAVALEIGPGGGRFSRHLIERCRQLVLVDVSSHMLQRTREACGGRAHPVLIGDGNLSSFRPRSLDFVFSFDVFLHLELEEVFRYLCAVNSALAFGGVFSVQVSTLESRWGFHSFLQQIRDQKARIGTRYGGRMYPLSDRLFRRLADHSGFEVADAAVSDEDKNLIYALRKMHRTRLWDYLTSTEACREVEISARIDARAPAEFFAGFHRSLEQRIVVLLGEAEDPWLLGVSRAEVPQHTVLASPIDCIETQGMRIVTFDGHRPRSLGDGLLETDEAPASILNRIGSGLVLAHESGLASGFLDRGLVVWDVAQGGPRIYGVRPYEPDEWIQAMRSDWSWLGGWIVDLAKRGVAVPTGCIELAHRLLEDISPEALLDTATALVSLTDASTS